MLKTLSSLHELVSGRFGELVPWIASFVGVCDGGVPFQYDCPDPFFCVEARSVGLIGVVCPQWKVHVICSSVVLIDLSVTAALFMALIGFITQNWFGTGAASGST